MFYGKCGWRLLAVGGLLVLGVLQGVAAETFPPLVGDGVADDTAAI